jgi:hypothetical protein
MDGEEEKEEEEKGRIGIQFD